MSDRLHVLGSATSVVFASISWVEVNAILSAIASCLAILISLCTLIGLLVKWFKKANEDGKITIDEIEEGLQIVTDGMKEINDSIKKGEEDDKERRSESGSR